MRPYGRNQKVLGFKGKESNFKVGNWWEEVSNITPRKTLNYKAIKEELELAFYDHDIIWDSQNEFCNDYCCTTNLSLQEYRNYIINY